MPSQESVSLKYSSELVKAELQKLSLQLTDILTSKKFSAAEQALACSTEYQDLSWLTPQEINSILDLASYEEKSSMLAHRIRFSLLPQNRVESRIPAYLLIEPTSVCNLRCPMCFQTDSSFTTSEFMGKISFPFFTSLIDKAYSAGVGAVTLASRGEPTLHPQLESMIRYFKGKFIEKKLNTNATRLTPAISEALLQSGFNHIVFSCDSHLKEEYETIRKGAVFENVLANIKSFWDIRNSPEYRNLKLRVSISGVKTLDTQNGDDFTAVWTNYCDDAYLSPAEERWDTYNNQPHPDITSSCIYPWERLYIWHDGTINPCDVDYKSFLSPGNINDFSTLEDAWQHLTLLRSQHLNGNRCNVSPCDRCGVYHPST